MNWEFMNFEIPVRTSTYLFSVRKMLEDRHGRIQDLKICLGSYLEEKEMRVRGGMGCEMGCIVVLERNSNSKYQTTLATL